MLWWSIKRTFLYDHTVGYVKLYQHTTSKNILGSYTMTLMLTETRAAGFETRETNKKEFHSDLVQSNLLVKA